MNRACDNPNSTNWSLIRKLFGDDDIDAWKRFYATYGPFLRSVALKTGLTPDEADDVVQETVFSMVKNFPHFQFDRAAGSFRSWLFQLARWRIANQRRKRSRFERTALPGGPTAELPDTASLLSAESIPDPAPGATEALWDAEWEKAALDIALEKMKQRERARHYQIFFLNVIRGQPPADVARALGTSVAQVYVVKCRLLPRLRRILKELDQTPL